MSNTLNQSTLNFNNVLNENNNKTTLLKDNTLECIDQKQLIIKNINGLSRNDLEKFLKVRTSFIEKRKEFVLFCFTTIEIWSYRNSIE